MQRLYFYIDSDFDIDIGKGFQKYIIMKVYHLHLSMSSEFAKIAKNILFWHWKGSQKDYESLVLTHEPLDEECNGDNIEAGDVEDMLSVLLEIHNQWFPLVKQPGDIN